MQRRDGADVRLRDRRSDRGRSDPRSDHQVGSAEHRPNSRLQARRLQHYGLRIARGRSVWEHEILPEQSDRHRGEWSRCPRLGNAARHHRAEEGRRNGARERRAAATHLSSHSGLDLGDRSKDKPVVVERTGETAVLEPPWRLAPRRSASPSSAPASSAPARSARTRQALRRSASESRAAST